MTFITTVFTWIGFIIVYLAVVLLIARVCGINSRYETEEPDYIVKNFDDDGRAEHGGT